MTKMLNEIFQQPKVLAGIEEANKDTLIALVKELNERKITHALLSGRGTSDHAAVYGQYLLGIYKNVVAGLSIPSCITLYNGNYDGTMHRWAPEGKESIDTLKANIAVFSEIHDAIKAKWSGHKTLLGFCPDHGCHEIDGGVGSHGLDMQEDMNIIHMFSFIK